MECEVVKVDHLLPQKKRLKTMSNHSSTRSTSSKMMKKKKTRSLKLKSLMLRSEGLATESKCLRKVQRKL